jgi:hypothetical protein
VFKNLEIYMHKTAVLAVILCGCGTYCLTVREEHRQRMFENKVLRIVFGPKSDDINRRLRKIT